MFESWVIVVMGKNRLNNFSFWLCWVKSTKEIVELLKFLFQKDLLKLVHGVSLALPEGKHIY